MYLDLNELDQVFPGGGLAAQGRPALLWFDRRSYLGDPAVPLPESVSELLQQRGRPRPAGDIRLLTQVRTLGYVFNPVSFYFTFDRQQQLGDIVAEVHNTPWNERHCYVITPEHYSGTVPRAQMAKQFHVSPFLPMDLEYRWRVSTPGRTLRIQIACDRQGQRQFTALLSLRRQPFSRQALWWMLLRAPCATYATMLRIYWQALRLWSKRVPFCPHPKALAVPPGLERPNLKPVQHHKRKTR
jgi:hypothetical protein